MNTILGIILFSILVVLLYLARKEEKRSDQYYRDLYGSKEEVKDSSVQITAEEIIKIAEEIQKQEPTPKKKKSRPRKKPASKESKKD